MKYYNHFTASVKFDGSGWGLGTKLLYLQGISNEDMVILDWTDILAKDVWDTS